MIKKHAAIPPGRHPGRPEHRRAHAIDRRFIAMRSHFGAGRRRVPIVPHVRYATKRRHVSFAPVCTKRRGATCDARKTAAPAPSWTVHCRMFPSCRASVATRDDAMRFHCGGSHCALAGTGRHEWRPYGALPHVPLCRMFVTPRNDDTFPLRRFAPNVGAPPRTPGIPPHPRHHGRFTAACPR